MTALTYPGGEIVSYEYYDDGSVRSMTSKSGGTIYTWEYTYDQYGRLKNILRPDGSEEERTYDEAGNMVKQVDMLGSIVLSENTYTYNVFGEVITKSTASGTDLSKLATVNMTYNAANRLETYNGQKVIYDKKGNMTYGPVDGKMQELKYDCRNRLVEAGGVSYTYDAENTRIATAKDGKTTEYVTNTGGSMSQLLTAYEADGTETRYFYGAEGLAGQYNTGTEQYLGYHYDNIGSTTMVTDITGTIAEQFAYGTYGELLTTVKNKIRFLYNGSYGVTTDENGLYYMRPRYYNPDIKVRDIGSSQSLNRYAYCEGNPVSLVDPSGLSPESTQDQGEESKYERLHNLLGTIGIFFDGADRVNGFIYLAEKDYVNAAILFACGIPAVGTVVTAVAKTAKLVKYASKAAKIAQTCRDIGRIGNAAAGMKALYDTYQTAGRECGTTGEKTALRE